MFEINFNAFDHNFCEATIYSSSQHPEYLNSISSLFITFIGLNGLAKPHLSLLLFMLYSSLSINGIASCLYHYYNSIGLGLIDRMSMILIAYSSSYLLFGNKNYIVHIILSSYFTILLTVTGLHIELGFNILFGIFLLSVIIYMSYVNISNNEIIIIGWKGVKYMMFSCIFWIVTEALCYKFGFIKYLFGHVFWHICVSYGGYLLSLVPHYILLSKNNSVIIEKDRFGIYYLDIYEDDIV